MPSPQPSSANRPDRAGNRSSGTRWMLWVFPAALAVRLVYFFQFTASPLFGDYRLDHLYYLEWGRRIAGGDWLGTEVFEQGPLYPYLLGIWFRVFGETLDRVLLVQMLLGSATCVLIASCARKLYDTPTALVAGLAAALYGPFVFYECLIMKSWLAPLLTIASLYSALQFGESAHTRWLWLGGLSVGLACLVRENHILLAAPWIWWIWSRENTQSATSRLRRLSHFAAAIALCIVLVTIRNWSVGRELVFVTSGGGEVFYMAHGPEATGYYNPPDFVLPLPEIEHDDFRKEAARRLGHPVSPAESSRFWFRQGLKSIVGDPVRTLRLTAGKAAILLNDFEVDDTESYTVARKYIPLLPLLPTFGWVAGFGLVGLCRAVRGNRPEKLAAGMLAAHAVVLLILYHFGRFRLGMMPVWIVFFSTGLTWTVRSLFAADRRNRILGGVAAVAACLASGAAFLSIEPVSYAISQSQVIGRLASQRGQYELAEAEYRRAILLLEQHGGGVPGVRNADDASLASAYAELGDVCFQTGREDEAIVSFRRARDVPARAEIRESVLLHSISLVHAMLRETTDPERRQFLRAENLSAARELTAIAPHEVRNWAMQLYYSPTVTQVQEASTGLETAWHELKEPTAEEQGWYRMGRAVFAVRNGDHSEAARDARGALDSFPGHPFRPELEASIENPRHDP